MQYPRIRLAAQALVTGILVPAMTAIAGARGIPGHRLSSPQSARDNGVLARYEIAAAEKRTAK